MNTKLLAEVIEQAVDDLSKAGTDKISKEHRLPSPQLVKDFIDSCKAVIFPAYTGEQVTSLRMLHFYVGVNLERVAYLLEQQLNTNLNFAENLPYSEEEVTEQTITFIKSIPKIKELLYKDAEAIFVGDPAASSISEVIFCYPALQALLHHRIAHQLLSQNIPLLPRMISEMAHSLTGIDIHPAANIGESFSIDHGTGVVVGETCIIGKNVRLYQGVTLGAKCFTLDCNGHPINTPRHPIIEDGVTIYANTTVLGRITIGANSVIGGNIWLTNDVPADSKVTQKKYSK